MKYKIENFTNKSLWRLNVNGEVNLQFYGRYQKLISSLYDIDW